MPEFDTRPSGLDDLGHPHHRRKPEVRMENFANNPLVRVIQFLVTSLLIPLILWIGNAQLDRMSKIESSVQELTSISKVNELRMSNLERSQSDRDAQIKALTEKSIVLDYELRTLKDRR